MANTLSAAGSTFVSWALSDDRGNSRSDSQRSTRAIANGTGPGQANAAWATTWSTTGSGGVSWDPGVGAASAFGVAVACSMSVMKEVLVRVTSGPTGGYITFGAPTGITGVRINVGGQFHLADYLTGLASSSGSWQIANGVTGSYAGDIVVVGHGVYEPI